jgi:hypothetical protein
MMSRGNRATATPTGGFTSVDGEEFYRISEYDLMPPFLMSIASDTDLWMFVSSRGGLTAGRIDADGSLFPYETVDRLHDVHHHTGPVTLIRTRTGKGGEALWKPFTGQSRESFRIERNLYKNTIGNRLLFEEINHDLGLEFRYRWSGCDEYGLVRTATLTNRGRGAVSVVLLDGLRNILPYGAPLALYQQSSSLVDAYKRSEVDQETKLGIFSLTSRIIDRAEAAEVLKANAVWCRGLEHFEVSLSIESIAEFRCGAHAGGESIPVFRTGATVPGERILTGRRGNYLVSSSFALNPGEPAKWHIAADIGLSHVRLAMLRARLTEEDDLDAEIEKALSNASDNLLRNVGSADGLQLTEHKEACVHHFANVLFNNMRGGVFIDNYAVPADDLVDFLRTRNRMTACRHDTLLEAFPAEISSPELIEAARNTGDPDFERLCCEYLPIYFSRRHGDPSRPWNRFSIHARDPAGGRSLRYEGNWRDIFQNWEALSMSFPRFLPSIIAKFINASTVDGFNPYRITRDGIDWEVVDPGDPWSYIGYWGDHQIIYLLKFLEAAERFFPGTLEELLEREIFCFADVPYRIKPYKDIIEDPNATINYDTTLASRIEDRVKTVGTDGRLVPGNDGSIYHVNLLEKLLIPTLSKLSNLVPDGGIWMNTQRPEWNDANNALVGSGLSMVTLCYLRRYLHFLEQLLKGFGEGQASISNEVTEWFEALEKIFNEHLGILGSISITDRDRKEMLDELGNAFSEYRSKVYSSGFSGKGKLDVQRVARLCGRALDYLDHSIRANRRDGGLYHSYNLLEITKGGKEISIRRLYEMLEGQVALLSSGAIEAKEAVGIISSLFESRMYDAHRRSFMLYPERELPGFLEGNTVPEDEARAIPLLAELLDADDRSIIERDVSGTCRFNGDFSNARDLDVALDRLAGDERRAGPVTRDRKAVLELFEAAFHHAEFTGRSGTMYGYEGLGCIYWHMVSKLLLAVQEIALRVAREGQSAAAEGGRSTLFENLAQAYYRIRSGLGFEKTVAEYGAFPTDPYSHTPVHAGAQQPGMTGQVKEEILTRFGELGIVVEEGSMIFRPVLLRRVEFLEKPGTYRFYDIEGKTRSIDVPAGGIAFSFCQVPIVYQLSGERATIRVTRSDGTSFTAEGDRLDTENSRILFDRSGDISRIDVCVPKGSLLRL